MLLFSTFCCATAATHRNVRIAITRQELLKLCTKELIFTLLPPNLLKLRGMDHTPGGNGNKEAQKAKEMEMNSMTFCGLWPFPPYPNGIGRLSTWMYQDHFWLDGFTRNLALEGSPVPIANVVAAMQCPRSYGEGNTTGATAAEPLSARIVTNICLV